MEVGDEEKDQDLKQFVIQRSHLAAVQQLPYNFEWDGQALQPSTREDQVGMKSTLVGYLSAAGKIETTGKEQLPET